MKNKITQTENYNDMMNYQKTENILNDMKSIIEISQKQAYRAVDRLSHC